MHAGVEETTAADGDRKQDEAAVSKVTTPGNGSESAQ